MQIAAEFDAASTPSERRPKLTLNWRGKTTPVPDIVFVEVAEPAPAAPQQAARTVAVTPFDAPTPLQICLSHWSDWMRRDDRDLGVKGQVGIASGSDEHEGYDDGAAISEAAAARASRDIAMATDAMIDSLPRHYKAAIYRSCNIASVWRFPNLDFTGVLPEAEKELADKLSKNVATRAFF
jgi:hypothetical protein